MAAPSTQAGPLGTDPAAAAANNIRDTVLVLMGVSGCGKTAIALNDADRWPWLERVAHWIDERLAAGEPGIITCSNLKRAYRRVTIGERKGVTLVYLQAAEPVIAARLAQRKHRYMPASLLHNQFQTLEEPAADEHPVTVAVDGTIADTVSDLLRKVAAG